MSLFHRAKRFLLRSDLKGPTVGELMSAHRYGFYFQVAKDAAGPRKYSKFGLVKLTPEGAGQA